MFCARAHHTHTHTCTTYIKQYIVIAHTSLTFYAMEILLGQPTLVFSPLTYFSLIFFLFIWTCFRTQGQARGKQLKLMKSVPTGRPDMMPLGASMRRRERYAWGRLVYSQAYHVSDEVDYFFSKNRIALNFLGTTVGTSLKQGRI